MVVFFHNKPNMVYIGQLVEVHYKRIIQRRDSAHQLVMVEKKISNFELTELWWKSD